MSGADKTGKTVVIVDDDAEMREMLVDSMDRSVSDVRTAADGEKGRDIILKCLNNLSKGSILKIITDFNMPGLDGVQMLQAVFEIQKGSRAQICAVILSGNPDEAQAAVTAAGIDCVVLGKSASAKKILTALAAPTEQSEFVGVAAQ